MAKKTNDPVVPVNEMAPEPEISGPDWRERIILAAITDGPVGAQAHALATCTIYADDQGQRTFDGDDTAFHRALPESSYIIKLPGGSYRGVVPWQGTRTLQRFDATFPSAAAAFAAMRAAI